jgi:hypothetical protein
VRADQLRFDVSSAQTCNLLAAAEEMRERLVAWCEHVRAPYLNEIKRRPLG